MLCAVVLNNVDIELRYGKLFDYYLEEIAVVVESEYENAFLCGSFRTFGNCEREVISVVFVDRCSCLLYTSDAADEANWVELSGVAGAL